MKVLELFAGTRSIGKAFEARGHEVFSVEWDKSFENIDLYKDVLQITPDEIIQKFGRPDVIWASPDCATYSIAAISRHRRRTAGGYEPGSSFGICQVLRPRESARPRADHVAVAACSDCEAYWDADDFDIFDGVFYDQKYGEGEDCE